MRVVELLTHEVNKLKSEEQHDDWKTLREAINDGALLSIPHDVFVMHMEIIHLQLLMACVVKQCSGGLSEMFRNPVGYKQHMDALTEPIHKMKSSHVDGKTLSMEYSKAFGASPTNADANMISVLQENTSSQNMSNAAVHFLRQHLTASYVAYKEGVERASGMGALSTDNNRCDDLTNAKQLGGGNGQGCLLCAAICAAGGWMVAQLLMSQILRNF